MRTVVKIRLYMFITLALIFVAISLLVMWLYENMEDDGRRHRAQFVHSVAAEGCDKYLNAS